MLHIKSICSILWKKRRVLLGLSLFFCVLLAGIIAGSRAWVLHSAKGRTFDDVSSLPANRVGVVLGCLRTLPNGRINLFFEYRMQAAAQAYNAGKVEYLIVSGDNHSKSYDEPTVMKDELIKLGIPEDKIYCDYAGFRTLDSIVRVKEVFQEDTITVISQEFHNQRAIYIGRARGLKVVGYNAQDVNRRVGIRTICREQLARVKAVLDVSILNKGPKFLGEPIYVGVSS